MAISELEDMYRNLVLECQSFEQKKEYVLENPELYDPSSLAILSSIIEGMNKSAGSAAVFRLHHNLLSEIGARGVEDAFRNYGYIDRDTLQLFFQYVNDPHTGISASNIVAQDKLCKLNEVIKVKLINWFIAFYPGHEDRIPYIKACIGVS